MVSVLSTENAALEVDPAISTDNTTITMDSAISTGGESTGNLLINDEESPGPEKDYINESLLSEEFDALGDAKKFPFAGSQVNGKDYRKQLSKSVRNESFYTAVPAMKNSITNSTEVVEEEKVVNDEEVGSKTKLQNEIVDGEKSSDEVLFDGEAITINMENATEFLLSEAQEEEKEEVSVKFDLKLLDEARDVKPSVITSPLLDTKRDEASSDEASSSDESSFATTTDTGLETASYTTFCLKNESIVDKCTKDNGHSNNEKEEVDDEDRYRWMMGKISRSACDWGLIFNDFFPTVPIIITNIAPKVSYGRRVRFYGTENPAGYAAQILVDVKYTGIIIGTSDRNQPVFEGTHLNPKHLSTKLKELAQGRPIMFYIPGFSEQPQWVMYELMSRKNIKDFLVVPLIGETPKTYNRAVNLFNYKHGRHYSAPNAGREFGELFDLLQIVFSIDNDPDLRMSIMANSQGNTTLRVLASFVRQKRSKLFENVFMVAADLPKDFFSDAMNPGNKKSNSESLEFGSTDAKGLGGRDWKYEVEKNGGYDVVDMVKRKVYVLWSPHDLAFGCVHDLLMINFMGVDINTLGECGGWASNEKIPGRLKRCFRRRVKFHQIRENVHLKDTHAYKFTPEAMKFYESKCNKRV